MNAQGDGAAPRPLIVVLLGPPGAGKGTQARMLERDRGLVQLSTGDLLRAAVARGTEAGRAAEAVMARGDLVSDEIVLAILHERMEEPDVTAGVILDGFPRTTGQAEALDRMLGEGGQGVDIAIALDVAEEAMVERISGRHTCAGCGEGYHDRFKPPRAAGICDNCGGHEFSRRPDDRAEVVRSRLEAYRAQTAPLIAYYADRGVLRRIDAMAPITEVEAALIGQLDSIAP